MKRQTWEEWERFGREYFPDDPDWIDHDHRPTLRRGTYRVASAEPGFCEMDVIEGACAQCGRAISKFYRSECWAHDYPPYIYVPWDEAEVARQRTLVSAGSPTDASAPRRVDP